MRGSRAYCSGRMGRMDEPDPIYRTLRFYLRAVAACVAVVATVLLVVLLNVWVRL